MNLQNLQNILNQCTKRNQEQQQQQDTSDESDPECSLPFQCEFCRHRFDNQRDCLRHERVHLDIRPFSCLYDRCEFCAPTKREVKSHIWTEHFQKEFGVTYRDKITGVSGIELKSNDYIDVNEDWLHPDVDFGPPDPPPVEKKRSKLVRPCGLGKGSFCDDDSTKELEDDLVNISLDESDSSVSKKDQKKKKRKKKKKKKKNQQVEDDESPSSFICQFEPCQLPFATFQELIEHERFHTCIRPYECKWEHLQKNGTRKRCKFRSETYQIAYRHIRVKHFKLPGSRREQKSLGIVDDRDADVYINVREELLEFEKLAWNSRPW